MIIEDAHHGATLKIAPHINDTRRQQARFTLDEGRSCPLIDDERGSDACGEGNPSPLTLQPGVPARRVSDISPAKIRSMMPGSYRPQLW